MFMCTRMLLLGADFASGKAYSVGAADHKWDRGQEQSEPVKATTYSLRCAHGTTPAPSIAACGHAPRQGTRYLNERGKPYAGTLSECSPQLLRSWLFGPW